MGLHHQARLALSTHTTTMLLYRQLSSRTHAHQRTVVGVSGHHGTLRIWRMQVFDTSGGQPGTHADGFTKHPTTDGPDHTLLSERYSTDGAEWEHATEEEALAACAHVS